MRRFKYVLISIALLSLVPSPVSAAVDLLGMAMIADIGHGYGKMAADAMQSAAEYQNSIAEFNRKIAAARAEFWRQYPNGPNIQAAQKNFSALLLEKDLLLMHQTSLSGRFSSGSRAQPNAMDLMNAIGGKVDGGVRPMAGSQFYTWIGLIRKRIGTHGPMNLFEFPGRYVTAISEAWPAYKPYVFARDYAEFAAAGRLPPGVTGPDDYIKLFLVLGLTDSLDWGDHAPSPEVDRVAEARAEAHDYYERLTKIFGEAKVRAVATQVMQMGVNQDGILKDPAAMGIIGWNLKLKRDVPVPSGLIIPAFGMGPYGAFFALLTNSGPREYLLGLVAEHTRRSNMTLGQWIAQAGPERQRLELAYGSETLTDAAEEVRRAPKRLYDGYLLESGINPYRAFMRSASSRNPRGFVRWLILTDVANISSKDALDAAYQKLAARYPEPKILKAARGLIDPQTLPWGLREIAFVPKSLGSLTALVAVLRGMDDPALMSQKEPERKKDLTYLSWESFVPGATVTVRDLVLQRQEPYTRKIPNGPDMQVAGWERVGDPGGQAMLTTTRLVSVDDKKIMLSWTGRVGNHPPGRGDVQAPANAPLGTVFTFPFSAQRSMNAKINLIEPVKKIESGTETLVIAGKPLQTRWWAVTREVTRFNRKEDRIDKVWFSDQVPGGIVKQMSQTGRVQRVDAFYVREVTSFQGETRPGAQNGLYSFLSASFGTAR